jgi:MFS family permease
MTAPPGAARTVLALVVALQLVAETALTPYWPRMFRELFGVTELAATGTFLTVCRVAGLVALPLWGLAARRLPLPRLLVAGLLVAAVCDAGLAVAPTVGLFTFFSAGSVAAGSSLVLAYPALVAVVEGRGRGDRLSAVTAYVAVFHASAVLATLVGAGVVALPAPRVGLGVFAVLDLALAWLVWRAVPVGASTGSARASEQPQPAPTAPLGLLGAVALLAVLVDLGFAVTRPFFVELVLARGHDLGSAGLLFLAPSLAALVVLPVARASVDACGRHLLPLAAITAATGLVVQAQLDALPWLVVGRTLLGAGLGLGMVALDLRIFAVVGTGGPAFSAVETARALALLAAPVLATPAAARTLGLPLLLGAGVFTSAAVVAVVVAVVAGVAGVAAGRAGPRHHSHEPSPIPIPKETLR